MIRKKFSQMINPLMIVLLLLFVFSCSDKNIRQDTGSNSGFTILRGNPNSPWKKLRYFDYYTVTCPLEWKITRDSSRVFLRPFENKPIGVIIGMENDDNLNRLELGKYFVHFFKNIAVPRNIRLTELQNINFNGVPALQCSYQYTNAKQVKLSGIQITLKHKNKMFFIVTESPESDNEKFTLSMKWILESIRFSGVSLPGDNS